MRYTLAGNENSIQYQNNLPHRVAYWVIHGIHNVPLLFPCFNYEMTKRNGNVISFDLIYQFSKEDIEKRIEEVRITVMQQIRGLRS